jgi:replication factor C small subunit
MTSESINGPWVEKYRPTILSDVIGDPIMLNKFNQYISQKDIPHLLFCGRAGTGKTTCARILATNVTSEHNILYINASQEKGVDTIRTKVDSFCSMLSIDGLRIIILDEFDGMTHQAMATMRNTMEEYIEGSRFILTCNYERKISEPISSRCQTFNFLASEKDQKVSIIRRCAHILKNENIKCQNIKVDLIKLVNKCYPDIRKTINSLQKLTVNGEFNYVDTIDNVQVEEKLISYIKQLNIKSIRQEIVGSVDYNDLYKILFNRALDINADKKLEIMLIVGDAVRWHSMVVDPEINFITCIIKICKELCVNNV